jgi:hypothetical protein
MISLQALHKMHTTAIGTVAGVIIITHYSLLITHLCDAE